jgi:cytochrome bd-type quinol oxidase subunit 2
MALTKILIPSSILRGLQALFAIIVLGLSVTLIKTHNPEHDSKVSHAPKILTCTAGIGGLTRAGALAGFVLAWTEFLRGYFEVVLDIGILLINLLGGVVRSLRLKPCKERSLTDTSS